MAKYIDWYLVEAESQLRSELPDDRLKEVIAEAESHLRESAEEQLATGLDPESAEVAAIQRFGRVRSFVQEVLAGQPGKAAKRLLFGGSVATAASISLYTCIQTSANPGRWGQPFLYIFGLAVALLVAGSWIARRRYGAFVLAGCLAGSALGFIAGCPAAIRLSTSARANQISAATMAAKSAANEVGKFARGKQQFVGKQNLSAEFASKAGYLAPYGVCVSFHDWPLLSWRVHNEGQLKMGAFGTGVLYTRVSTVEGASYLAHQRTRPRASSQTTALQLPRSSRFKSTPPDQQHRSTGPDVSRSRALHKPHHHAARPVAPLEDSRRSSLLPPVAAESEACLVPHCLQASSGRAPGTPNPQLPQLSRRNPCDSHPNKEWHGFPARLNRNSRKTPAPEPVAEPLTNENPFPRT